MDVPIIPVVLKGEKPFEIGIGKEIIKGYFHDTGSDPVGIYLHGFRSHCNGEKSLVIARHAQAKGRSWIRFDMRGHGLSGGQLKDQLISSSLRDILEVIGLAEHRPVILHGSSMGGWIALLAALRLQGQTSGLMLIAPAFNFIQNNFSCLPGPVLQEWNTRGYRSFPDAYGGEPYTLNYGVIADAESYDVLGQKIRLNIPVHIVHGENDPIVPVSTTEKFIQRAQISRLAFERIPGAGHRLTDQLPLIISHIEQLWQEIE